MKIIHIPLYFCTLCHKLLVLPEISNQESSLVWEYEEKCWEKCLSNYEGGSFRESSSLNYSPIDNYETSNNGSQERFGKVFTHFSILIEN